MDAARDPIQTEHHGRVLTIQLDTPGCDVNIFSERAATQLRETMAAVDPSRVRAVVLRSGKPGSFVNGVGLMLANAVQHPSDVERLTKPMREAYRALDESPVPTIAAVQGNCYGCGVELAMMCDYRVAQPDWDTHFYMTEVADYLFVPCFGATKNLPRLVGLPAATDFLLWGHRWSAFDAERHGLVDAAFEPSSFEAALDRFVGETCAGAQRPRPRTSRTAPDHDTFVADTRARIDSLPARVRDVYRECFDLMEAAARAETVGPEHDERELLAAGQSVIAEPSKNAQSFFFVRQMARRLATRGASPMPRRRLILQDMPIWEATLRARRPLGVEVLSADDTEGHDGLWLGPYGDHGRVDATAALLPVRAGIHWGPGIVAYAPFHVEGIDLVEVAVEDGSHAPKAAEIGDALAKAGFEPVLSRPEKRFVMDEMVDAYFAPLQAHVEAGGSASEADAVLRGMGFMRGPAQLAALMPEHPVASLFADTPGPAAEATSHVGTAVLLSLLRFALRAHRQGVLAHPSLVDLMARELLSFPLADGSLCRFLSPARAGELVAQGDDVATLLPPDTLDMARAYHTEGQGFYR